MEEIEDTCTNKEVVALVVGTKEMSGLERFLLGNTAISIIKNCSSPVLTVPQGAPIKAPRKIALAVDNSEGLPVEKIANLLQLFRADLHVVHVETENETSRVNLPEALKGASYHHWKENDVNKGIGHFVQQNNIDLLLVLPHRHNLFERVFFKGHTKELVNSMPVPVLCIR